MNIRKRKNLTQTELAKLAGISQKALSELETGKSKGISFSTLSRLCDVMNINLESLFEIVSDSDGAEIKITLLEMPCCSFCNKKEKEVDTLIVGKPNKDKPKVYICSECIKHCNNLISAGTKA